MDRGFSIRPAAEDEMAVVALLFREYAASLNVDLAYQGFVAELAGLPGPYAPPRGTLLLAVGVDGQALGCVAVRSLLENQTCEMKRLYARSAARGLGVGGALARSAIEAARQAGYRVVCLDTLPGMTAAQALYRQLGFVETQAYYPSPIAGTIFMRKVLF